MEPEKWQRIKEIFCEVLEAPEDEREDLLKRLSGDDAGLQSEVEALLAAHYESESFIAKPAFEIASVFEPAETPAAAAGKIFGHYRIVREIGAGGMGAVFLAERADGEFEQQVAVKIVRQTVADSEVIHRFRRERQILASLHHPNIAQLVDGGVSPDGLPYLAMEYIEGEPVTEYARKNNLSIEERLRLFLRICSGVAYAHRHLIVHRDLKPSNVLITSDGIPKLLDFGLAKLLSDNLEGSSEETRTAFRALTLAYASPEQLRGEKITTASDIYSLGVVLYELLAGDRPFHFKNQSIDEAIRLVCETNPLRPSDAVVTRRFEGEKKDDEQHLSASHTLSASQLKGDLDNIVLMAMSREPERRYPTVEKFAEDIERYLQGLPVRARSATFSYRAEKFIRRNYLSVAAAALILLSLVGGLAATVWQARRAAEHQARAERRFNEVRKLSQSLMFEIHDSVQTLQGSTPTRQLIVSRALEYLNSLAQESGDDFTLRRELATAFDKIGDIQGNPYLSNLGDTPGALESYRRSAAIREQLVSADPQNVDVRRELATSYDHIGDILGRTGDRSGAIEAIGKSIAIRRQLIAENAGDAQLRFELGTSQMKIGEHQHSSGDLKAALDNEIEALSIFEALASADAQNAKAARGVMVTSNKIGYMIYAGGDLPAALGHYQKGYEIADKLAQQNTSNAHAMRDLSICLNNLGRIYLKQKDAAAAGEAFGKSLAISQKLSDADPKNVQFRSDAAYALVRLGAAQSLGGRYQEALESQRRAIAINEALLTENPKNMLMGSEIGDSHNYMGEAYEKMGDLKAALESYRKSAEVRERNSATDPNDAQYRQSVAESYQTLGRIFSQIAAGAQPAGSTRLAQLSDARQWYQRSLEIWQELDARKALSPAQAENITMIQTELTKCNAELAKL